MANSKKRRNATKGLRYAAQMDSQRAIYASCVDTGEAAQYETPLCVADVQRQRGKTTNVSPSEAFVYSVRMEHEYGTGRRTRVYRAAKTNQ